MVVVVVLVVMMMVTVSIPIGRRIGIRRFLHQNDVNQDVFPLRSLPDPLFFSWCNDVLRETPEPTDMAEVTSTTCMEPDLPVQLPASGSGSDTMTVSSMRTFPSSLILLVNVSTDGAGAILLELNLLTCCVSAMDGDGLLLRGSTFPLSFFIMKPQVIVDAKPLCLISEIHTPVI